MRDHFAWEYKGKRQRTRRLLTLAEAGELLHLAPATLRRQALAGKLNACKFGRDWLVSPEAVAAYRAEYLGQRGRYSHRKETDPQT